MASGVAQPLASGRHDVEQAPPASVEAPSSSRKPRIGRIVLATSLIAGVGLRLLQYLANRSLWLDEALLSSSILNRPFAGLLEPLDYTQTAPAGFLFAEKLATEALGTSEYALRLVPLLAGLLSLGLFHGVARRYVRRSAVPLAVALFALSPFLIYYSSEVKQYSLDVLVSVVILRLAADLERRGCSRGRIGALMAVGTVAVWFSQPAIFVLGGVCLTLLGFAVQRGDRRTAGALVGAGPLWLTSFAGSYAASRAGLADPAYMQAFWREGFAPLPPRSLADWAWLPGRAVQFFRDPLGVMSDVHSQSSILHPAAALFACGLGCVWMYRRRQRRLLLLVSPIPLVLLASILKLYPLGGSFLTGGRLLMFLLPPAFLLVAAGAEGLRLRLRGTRLAPVSLALIAILLVPFAAYAAHGVPQTRQEVKPLLSYARENWRPGDLLYVYYELKATARYYAPGYGFQPAEVGIGTCSRLNPVEYLNELAALPSNRRFWFLFSDGKAAFGYDEKRLMLDYLEHFGRRLDDQVSVGASLYLYELADTVRPGNTYAPKVPVFRQEIALDCRGPWGPD